MQPTFLPWLGYFALMADANLFVFLDNFQFSRQSYGQRNRLFIGNEKADWVTVPVSHDGNLDTSFREVVPGNDAHFQRRFLTRLQQTYGKCPYFDHIYSEVEAIIRSEWPNLAEFNIAFIQLLARHMGIETRTARGSDFDADGQRSRRVVALLKATGAATYLSAQGAFGYMRDDGIFPLSDIEVWFQDYQPAAYPQKQSKDFVPYLSALDALLQGGPEGARAAMAAGQRPFKAWQAMLAEVHNEETV